jgi:hypothetical protein
MGATLNQPRRVQEDGPLDCKLLLSRANGLLYAKLKVLEE